MSVRDMEGAVVSTLVFSGLYALNNGIKANVFYLANALEPVLIALEILGTLQAVYNFFYFVYVRLFHLNRSLSWRIYVTFDTKGEFALR
ncbi:MAG: hypothetical protein JRJ47_02670 [Deltaproteobacteria bacterium]|nr:hypothetical protein [Deltaproteobacteria bacterium]